MITLLAHAGGGHEEVTAASSSLFDTLVHQPTWVALIIVTIVVFAFFSLLGLLRINLLTRLLLLIPALIGIAVFYLPHQPMVTTVLLSLGFIGTFFLVFTMLAGGKH